LLVFEFNTQKTFFLGSQPVQIATGYSGQADPSFSHAAAAHRESPARPSPWNIVKMGNTATIPCSDGEEGGGGLNLVSAEEANNNHATRAAGGVVGVGINSLEEGKSGGGRAVAHASQTQPRKKLITNPRPKSNFIKKSQQEEEKEEKAKDELTGLTLSLLLRDYCEFTGMTDMFINVALIVCFILLVRYESYGAQTGTLTYDTINQVTTSSATGSQFASIQSAAAYTCTALHNIVSDSITNNLRPESNDIAFGTRALLRAVEVEFFLPSSSSAAEEVNVKYLGACNEPGSCSTAADCIAAKNMLCSNDTLLYTGFEDIFSFFVDAQTRRQGNGIVVFDTRTPSTTTSLARAHIDTMCNSVLPTLLPFTSIVIFHAYWQSYIEPSAQTISEVKIGMLRPAQASILSSSSFYVIPTSLAVYPSNVWEPVRTLLEFIIVVAVLIEAFYELDEMSVSYRQNKGWSFYLKDRWNQVKLINITRAHIFSTLAGI